MLSHVAGEDLGAAHEAAGVEYQPQCEQRAIGVLVLGVSAQRLRLAARLALSVQARFASSFGVDLAARVVLAGFALIALAHPGPWIAAAACVPVALFAAFWFLRRRGGG